MIDPELDADVREALLAERTRPSPLDEAARQRVLARIAFSVAGLVGVGAIGGTAFAGLRHAASSSSLGIARAGLAKLLVVSALSFAAGGGTHVLYTHMARTAPLATPATIATPPSVAQREMEPPVPAIAVSSLPAAPGKNDPSVSAPTASVRNVEPSGFQLRERALLEAAQSALARGNAEEALTMVGRHTADFPQSELGEEREAIRIRALARLDRCSEARSSIERFAQRFPHSLQRGSLERLCLRGTP